MSLKGADELDLSSFQYGGMNVTGFSIKDPPFEENFQQNDCNSFKGLCPVNVRSGLEEKCLVNIICIIILTGKHTCTNLPNKILKKKYMEHLFFIASYFFHSINWRLWWTLWSSWVTPSTRPRTTIIPPCFPQTPIGVRCQNNTEILDENS